jgi:hypothetical protein
MAPVRTTWGPQRDKRNIYETLFVLSLAVYNWLGSSFKNMIDLFFIMIEEKSTFLMFCRKYYYHYYYFDDDSSFHLPFFCSWEDIQLLIHL